MPELIIRTNLSRNKFPADFIQRMTEILVKTLEKPEKYISINVFTDVWMSWGGTEDPCANCSLTSIGKLGPGKNAEHALAIMGYLYEVLGISKDRMYLSFHDSKPEDMGYSGTTFKEIFEARK